MSRLIVRHHRPWRQRLLLAALVVAVFLAGWGVFEYGRYRAGFDAGQVAQRLVELNDGNEELRQLNTRLREEKAILERSTQVERQAYKELEGEVTRLQDEIAELKGELAFYRGIVSPRDATQGLRVASFELTPTGVPGSYRYKLVLTQVLKNDTFAYGKTDLSIEGTMGGEAKVLQLAEVSPEKVTAHNFKFRYFQNFEGEIVLPEGFTPNRVVIKVDPSGRKHSDFEESYDWPTEGA